MLADGTMVNTHKEMHDIYGHINGLWANVRADIIDDDRKTGKIAEIIRWCRDRLGGRDQDLVGPERWEIACREGWSAQATFSCLPFWRTSRKWREYIHDVSHVDYLMLPIATSGNRNYDGHSLEHAKIELALTEMVVGWLADEARGINHSFPPLELSRPPDLRRPHVHEEVAPS